MKPQQVTALHLFSGLAFAGTGAIMYVYNFELTRWGAALFIIGILLIVLTMVKNRSVLTRKVNMPLRIIEFLVSTSILALSAKEWWKFPLGIFSVLSLVLLFSLFWERNAGRPFQVIIDEAGVAIPTQAGKKLLTWTEIEQVLLRYGVLSIDCVDNRLFQLDIRKNDANTQEVETYCAAMISGYIEKRDKNNW